MPIKVFISHKQEDEAKAKAISERLRTTHQIDTYLDVLDAVIGKSGEELAKYVRAQMGACTHLLAVVTPLTKQSWWVPWEIGVASEKDYPLSTYSTTSSLPEFLQKWPVLRNDQQLDVYAQAAKAGNRKRLLVEATVAQRSGTEEFYRVLRAGLAQY